MKRYFKWTVTRRNRELDSNVLLRCVIWRIMARK
jgi:hypothetical protein